MSDIGDIRATIIDYLKKNPEYQGKTLLFSILENQILDKRIESARKDPIDEIALKFFKKVKSDKDENPLVREKAQKIYNKFQ